MNLQQLQDEIKELERFSHLDHMQEKIEFYKSLIANIDRRDAKAFDDGWRMAYRNVGWGHGRFTQHEADIGYNLWLGLDAHGNEIK